MEPEILDIVFGRHNYVGQQEIGAFLFTGSSKKPTLYTSCSYSANTVEHTCWHTSHAFVYFIQWDIGGIRVMPGQSP